MKFITMAAMKGGVGKTTLTYNYAEWLASKGKKVLLFDLDDVQCSLSRTYDVMDANNPNNITNIFKSKQDPQYGIMEIKCASENIDIIAGDFQLDYYEHQILTETDKNRRIFEWFKNVYQDLPNYDYVIFDCHPNFDVATSNAVLCSNVIFNPITPSEYGYAALGDTQIRLDDYRQKETNWDGTTLVNAQLYGIGNMVKHNTKPSHAFVDKVKDMDNVVTIIPEKELFNVSTLSKTPVVKMCENRKIYLRHRKFFDNLDKSFQKMTDVVNQAPDSILNQIIEGV